MDTEDGLHTKQNSSFTFWRE